MTNFTALQTSFMKDDVFIRLQNLNNHLKQIQSLSQDHTPGNESVKNLIRETMYFIEWIGPDVEFDHRNVEQYDFKKPGNARTC